MIGLKLKLLRVRLGLSQKELAEKIGYTQPSIGRYENMSDDAEDTMPLNIHRKLEKMESELAEKTSKEKGK